MVSPGSIPRLDAQPSGTEGLVRHGTPLLAIGLLAFASVAGLAVVYSAGLPGQPGLPAFAIFLLAGLAAAAFAVHDAVRAGGRAAAEARRESAEAARQGRLLRLTFDGAAVGLGLIDARGGWVRANRKLCAILGRTEAELLRTTLYAVTADAHGGAIGSALAALQVPGAQSWEAEITQVRADGDRFPVSISIGPVTGTPSGALLLLVQETDTSDSRQEAAVGAALVAVRHTIARSATWEQAAPHVLTTLGPDLGWDVAQYWALDPESGAFKLGHSRLRDEAPLAEFDSTCRTLGLPAGEGVFGRAAKSGVPAVIGALSPLNEPTLGGAAWRAGLTQAVACPVIGSEGPAGLIVLFAKQARDVQDDVITMLSTAGSEIGEFIRRSEIVQVLTRSEVDHRTIFERAPIGIGRISAEGEMIEGNAALTRMLEHDFATLRTQVWPELLRAYDVAAAKSHLGPLLAGVSDGGSVQVRAATGGGRWLWLQMTATSIPDRSGRPEHVLLMVEDVTTVREAQDKLAEALEAQRSANVDLEKLDHTKTEFLSIVSHEFRTALTGIQGFSELIRDGGLEPDELRAYAGYIFNDADRVNRLIGDMLDLDRMESGRMTMRVADVDINEVLSDAIARSAPSTTVEFKSDLDPRLPIVAGDRDRLIQVVSNLVSNSVKYSPEGGTVTLSSQVEGGYALITVADTGLGIPQDEIAHVFERFRRVRSGAAQSIAGTGLGLTIVKQIVEMHGGKIWVESAVGHGSAFHFTVPLAARAISPAAQLRHA